MSLSQQSLPNSQLPKPPTLEETLSNPAPTLAWIETHIVAIYSAPKSDQHENKPLSLDRGTYLDIYTATHNYCTATKAAKKNKKSGTVLTAEDLYRVLEREIRNFCLETRAYIFDSGNSTTDGYDSARRLLKGYTAQWNTFVHVAGLSKNMMQALERHWIQREIDEKNHEVYLIQDLHYRVWREVVLQIGMLGTTEKGGLEEILDAVGILQEHGEGMSIDDRKLLEVVLKSPPVVMGKCDL